MLIDELIHNRTSAVGGDDEDIAMASHALVALPVAALYDVNNIWKALHDHRADQTRLLASKAPAYPKWESAWLEYKYDAKHRRGILATWLSEEGRYACDLFSEHDPVTGGTQMRLGVFAGCFSLLVEEDYYSVIAESGAVEDEEKPQYEDVVELATTALRFLNWSRSLVPTTVINGGTNKHRNKSGKPPLSSPTIIKIELALQMVRTLSVGGTHESPLYHAVAGHLRRIPPSHPLMGVARRGQNYEAVLEIEPHFRGDRSRGREAGSQRRHSGRMKFVSGAIRVSVERKFPRCVCAGAKPDEAEISCTAWCYGILYLIESRVTLPRPSLARPNSDSHISARRPASRSLADAGSGQHDFR